MRNGKNPWMLVYEELVSKRFVFVLCSAVLAVLGLCRVKVCASVHQKHFACKHHAIRGRLRQTTSATAASNAGPHV